MSVLAGRAAGAPIQVENASSIAFEEIELAVEKNGKTRVRQTLWVRPSREGTLRFALFDRSLVSEDRVDLRVRRGGAEEALTPRQQTTMPALAGFETVSDSRVVIIDCPHVLPDAIVICSRVEHHETPLTLDPVTFDRREPSDSIRVSLHTGKDAAARWLLVDSTGVSGPTRGRTGADTSVEWTAAGRTPLVFEPLAPSDLGARLHIVPCASGEDRSAESEGPEAESWAGLGRWWSTACRRALTPDSRVRAESAALFAGGAATAGAPPASTSNSVADKIYQHIQSKYRYVAIELGIGGYVPDRAGEIVARKYGDCKELSAAMVSMLEAQDVAARLVLVRAGPVRPLDAEFPSPTWFNHAIVAVPRPDRGYRFYDPTDALIGAGRVPWEDVGGPVLVAGGDDGGMLVMPSSDSEEPTEVELDLVFSIGESSVTEIRSSCRLTGYEADRARRAERGAEDSLDRLRERWLDESFLERSQRVAARSSIAEDGAIILSAEHTSARTVNLLSDGRRVVRAASVASGGHLDGMERVLDRRHPARIPYPLRIRQRVQIVAHGGAVPETLPETRRCERDGYTFQERVSADSSGTYIIEREVELRLTWYDAPAARVLAADWGAFLSGSAHPIVFLPQ